jgi:hypothetical protein
MITTIAFFYARGVALFLVSHNHQKYNPVPACGLWANTCCGNTSSGRWGPPTAFPLERVLVVKRAALTTHTLTAGHRYPKINIMDNMASCVAQCPNPTST